MSRHVPDERLGAIQEHLIRAIRNHRDQQWVSVNEVVLCRGEDLSSLLDELRRRRQSNGQKGSFKLGPTAKLLINMKVGETVEIPPVTEGALTTARKTARRVMNNPEAVWHSYVQPNGLQRVTRAPDGSPAYQRNHNPAVAQMAAMRIGQTITLTTVKGRMYTGLKALARRKLDKADAQWACVNLANGDIRCTRTA